MNQTEAQKTESAPISEEVDLSSLGPQKTYPYYDPVIRQPLYLLLPLLVIAFVLFHVLKNRRIKIATGRKPEMFFYSKDESRHEKI